MNEFVLARVIHILAVVLWIGGVAMVTTVLLPAIRALASDEEKLPLFERIESRFSVQAKVTTLLTGLSGFYMLHVLDAWSRYTEPRYWWIHAMTLVWVIFTLILFVIEPLFMHRWVRNSATQTPARTFAKLQLMHVILLLVSLVTIAGAVAGSHGWFWF
jgi:uncharacterized membrane protein